MCLSVPLLGGAYKLILLDDDQGHASLQGQLSAHNRTIQSNIVCSVPGTKSSSQGLIQNSTDNTSFS